MSLVVTIPQPQGLEFTAWGAQVAEQLAAFGITAPADEDGWKTWVSALFYVPELTALNIPSAEGFPDWQTWACQFVDSVR